MIASILRRRTSLRWPSRRSLRGAPVAAPVLALSLLSSGCGAGMQLVAGWSSRDVSTRREEKTVHVTSVPAGAVVVKRDPSGQAVELGAAPLQDTNALEVRETRVKDENTWLWAGGVAELIAGVVAVAATMPADGEPATDQSQAGETIGGAFALAGLVDVILALVHDEEQVVERQVTSGAGTFTYTARLPGLPEATSTLAFPESTLVKLVLDPAAEKAEAEKRLAQGASGAHEASARSTGLAATDQKGSGTASTSGAVPSATAKSWIIAVMDVVDANAEDGRRALDKGLVRNLGDQIRVFVAEQGLRTIDRGSQERALKERIAAMKSESYKSCYADNCQIELGKALAASHILRTHITRFGSKCVLNGELIDLKTEVTAAASSAQGTCEAEGFLGMGEQVARTLVGVR